MPPNLELDARWRWDLGSLRSFTSAGISAGRLHSLHSVLVLDDFKFERRKLRGAAGWPNHGSLFKAAGWGTAALTCESPPSCFSFLKPVYEKNFGLS